STTFNVTNSVFTSDMARSSATAFILFLWEHACGSKIPRKNRQSLRFVALQRRKKRARSYDFKATRAIRSTVFASGTGSTTSSRRRIRGRLAFARGRHNSIHPQVFHHLPVMVERVCAPETGQRQPRVQERNRRLRQRCHH